MTLYLARFLVMGIFGAAGLKTIHDLERPLAFRIPRQIYGQVLKSFFEKGIIGRCASDMQTCA